MAERKQRNKKSGVSIVSGLANNQRGKNGGHWGKTFAEKVRLDWGRNARMVAVESRLAAAVPKPFLTTAKKHSSEFQE